MTTRDFSYWRTRLPRGLLYALAKYEARKQPLDMTPDEFQRRARRHEDRMLIAAIDKLR